MNDIIIFLHLPRTGGTTLRDILSKQYSEAVTFENKTLLDIDHNFIANNKFDKADLKLIKGHVYFGIHEYIPQKCAYFSMMRDPIERVISVYNYVKNRPNHRDHIFIRNMSIEDYVQSGRNLFLDNGQTRLLAGRSTSLEVPFRGMNEEHLEQAKESIKNHFILVGLNEKYDETLLMLQKLLNWKTPTYSIANAVKRGKSTKVLSPQVRKLIAKYNQLDLQLYQHVSELFDDHVSHYSNMTEEIKKFKLKNRIASKFQIGSRLRRKINKWIRN
ncbi:MAG: sulfotransferase family 2 domain-containing protein [Fidelibacterota bacterium]